MSFTIHRPSRRAFLGTMAAGGAFFATKGAFAEQLSLALTPSRTEGPFYPTSMPLDRDNDLIIIKDGVTPAVGDITHLTGRILNASGSPIKDATIEIWQCDAKEVYHGTSDADQKPDQLDKNFQGYGKFTTGSTGEYRFRTIKPVPYPGRPAPHIHFKVNQGNREILTSQINIAGHPGNAVDGVVNGGISTFDKELLMAEFKPVKGSKIGEYAANFDVIIGRTPDEGRGR